MVRVCTGEVTRKLWKVFTSCPFSLHFFLSVHIFPQVFPFDQLITIKHDLFLRLIQTLCPRLSRSTLLRETLTVDHYLRIDYFQQELVRKTE